VTSLEDVPVLVEEDESRDGLPLGSWMRLGARLFLAVCVAGAVGLMVTAALPRHLDVRTDVVGSPIVHDFNVGRYWQTYLVWVTLVPVLGLVAYVLLPRVAPALNRPGVTFLRLERRGGDPTRPALFALLPIIGRVAVVAVAVGLELGLTARRAESGWPRFLFGSLGYLAVALLAGVLLCALRERSDRRRITLAQGVAVVNLVGTAAVLVGAAAATQVTSVLVTPTGTLKSFPWLPVPLVALPAAVILWRDVVHLLRYETTRVRARERRRLVFLVAPIIVFLLQSRLPGTIVPPEVFHDGEQLSGAYLLEHGWIPFRDFFVVHGLLNDSLEPALSMRLLEHSYWGSIAGEALVVTPLYWVSLYLLCAMLVQRSWAMLTLCIVVFAFSPPLLGGLFGVALTRFLLVPLLMFTFLAVLRRPTWPRAAAFAGVLVGQALIVPETAYLAIILPVLVVAYDLRGYRLGQPLPARLLRTRRVAACGAVAVGLLVVFLAAMGALGGFVVFLRTFSSEHDLTGGISATWPGIAFAVGTYLIPVLVVLSFAFVVGAIRTGHTLRTEDWVALALAAYAAVYYRKFLSRADIFHLYHSLAIAVPLIVYALHRATEALNGLMSRLYGSNRRPVVQAQSFVLLAGLLAAVFPYRPLVDSVGGRIDGLPGQLQAQTDQAAVVPSLGHIDKPQDLATELHDLRTLLSSVGPSARLYDFANEPGLTTFMLGQLPISRYINASQAIRQSSQAEVTHDLATARPEVVLYWGRRGLPMWDGIVNPVRHYDISEYILRHYRGWLEVDGQVLMLRNDLPLPPLPPLRPLPPVTPESPRLEALIGSPRSHETLLRAAECAWGFAPNFLSTLPTERGTPVGSAPASATIAVGGVATDGSRQVEAVVVTIDDEVALVEDTRARWEVFEANGLAPDPLMPFGWRVPVTGSGDPVARLGVFTIEHDGLAHPLAFDTMPAARSRKPAPRRAALQLRDRTVSVSSQPSAGHLNTLESEPASGGRVRISGDPSVPLFYVTRLQLPPGSKSASWLTLSSAGGLRPDQLEIVDQLGEALRMVSFAVKAGRERVGVQIASCPQWHSWQAPSVYVMQTTPVADATWSLIDTPKTSR
jgi:hypothetical protein